METQTNNQTNSQLGCLLSGILVYCILEAILMNLVYGGNFIVNLQERSWLQNLLAGVMAVVCLSSFYFIVISFMCKKAGMIGLLCILLLWSVMLLFTVVIPTPTSPESKAGAGWGLIFLILNVISIVIIALNLKRFRN